MREAKIAATDAQTSFGGGLASVGAADIETRVAGANDGGRPGVTPMDSPVGTHLNITSKATVKVL
jgi:hypothetical protein